MTASMGYASAESPTALACYRSHGGPLGCGHRDPGAGSSRIDRDWHMAEVAAALRITVPTAKTRANRARLSLRKRLSMFMASAGTSGVSDFYRTTHVFTPI